MSESNHRISRRKLLGATGAGAAGVAIGGAAWKGLGGSSEAGEQGAAAEARPKRNVILIVIDSLRADRIGCYGNGEMHTPALDRLARESTRFTRVFPEAMPTVPARRSILTGQRSFPFHDWQPWWGMAKRPGWEPILPRTRTLVEDMRDAGYWTSYVSDNPFLTVAETFEPFRAKLDSYVSVLGQRGEHRPPSTVPLSEARNWLPAAMRDDEAEVYAVQRYLANNGRGENAGQTAAARVFQAAAQQLDEAPDDRPFFLGVDAFDPHEPWAPPPEYMSMYGDPDYEGPEVANLEYRSASYLTSAELERLQVIYKASVTMVDDWLGRFLDRVRDRGLAESTVIG
ncbi:MAG: sulfatase-like hydrolase/transferase, partial [Thermoleophilaceae bacterium]